MHIDKRLFQVMYTVDGCVFKERSWCLLVRGKGDIQVFECILNASNDRYTIIKPVDNPRDDV